MVDKIDINDSILILGDAIKNSPASHYSIHKKNQRIDIKTNEQLAFFEEGKISFYRVHDDVLTISMSAPCIAGMAQMLYTFQTHYIKCEIQSKLWLIDISDAIKLFSNEGLWMHAYNVLAKQTQQYFEREYLILQKNTRSIVLQHLEYIWDMNDEDRCSTSIYSFILLRNHLSRSSIHKIISDLELEEIIKTNKGKLIYLKK